MTGTVNEWCTFYVIETHTPSESGVVCEIYLCGKIFQEGCPYISFGVEILPCLIVKRLLRELDEVSRGKGGSVTKY